MHNEEAYPASQCYLPTEVASDLAAASKGQHSDQCWDYLLISYALGTSYFVHAFLNHLSRYISYIAL